MKYFTIAKSEIKTSLTKYFTKNMAENGLMNIL